MRPRSAVAVRSGAVVVLLVAITALSSACGSTDGGSGSRPPRAPTEPPASNEAPTDVLELDVDSLVAIAINADPTAHSAAVLYARSFQEDPFVAPTGHWFLLVYAPDLGVYRSPKPVVSDGVLPIDLTAAYEPVPGAGGPDPAEAMEAFANFFVAHQRAQLASMSVLSGNFREPLMDPEVVVTADDAQTLRDLLYELDGAVDGAVAAVEVLSVQAWVSAEARPAGGPFDWLQDRITDVGGGRDRAAKARDEIVLAADRMTADERVQALEAISSETGFGAGERGAEDFFLALRDGRYDNEAAQIRNYLQDHEDFFHFFDKRNIETARGDGGALLVAGTEFYADAIKDVLDGVFPGFGEEWELVEKLEARLQQEKEPSSFVLRASLRRYLDEYGYEYGDEQVDDLMAGLLGAVARARSGGAPEAPATPTQFAEPVGEGDEYGVFVHEYFGMLVGRADELAATLTCGLSGGGLCAGEDPEKTPEPVPMVLGPFDTYDEAVEAYCADIIPGTYYIRPQGVGLAATMGFDGEEHAVDSAPGCT